MICYYTLKNVHVFKTVGKCPFIKVMKWYVTKMTRKLLGYDHQKHNNNLFLRFNINDLLQVMIQLDWVVVKAYSYAGHFV